MINRTLLFQLILGFVIFIAGAGLGAYNASRADESQFESVREGQEGYTYINPLLFTKTPGDEASPEYLPIKETVSNYASNAIAKGDVQDLSVYFREMNSGKWIATSPEERFTPASMLKVLTLIAAMRVAESDPTFLSKWVFIQGDDEALANSQTRYPVQDPIRSGHSYLVQTLLDHLIIDSDNVANEALTNLIGAGRINKVYDDLQLPIPGISAESGYTTREYSRLFRTLYNGTYLSHALSEKVLELLSKTHFDAGLVSGVPEGTVVAHKFGIKTVLSDTLGDSSVSYRELHDCGIVYFPEHPYFLCIMTRGKEFSVLESVLQDISRIVWEEVSLLYPRPD